MSAAEHLQEAIDVGCTRDDHDHVGDHRAEVLVEAADVADRFAQIKLSFGDLHAGRGIRAVARKLRQMAGKDTSDAAQAPAGESTQPTDAAALLALATVLEIPRPGTGIPFQLRRSHGHADRWAICDRTGRRWYPQGWMYEPSDDRLCDDGRFTLAEAVPLARSLAGGDPAPFVPPRFTDTSSDEWVRCSSSHCPSCERYDKATGRGWVNGHMDSWHCPDHSAQAEAPTYADTRGEPGGDH